jgi:hypothetical protein
VTSVDLRGRESCSRIEAGWVHGPGEVGRTHWARWWSSMILKERPQWQTDQRLPSGGIVKLTAGRKSPSRSADTSSGFKALTSHLGVKIGL